jgi:hypothetical protein
MFRKYLITVLSVALFSLTACGESEPPKPVQGSKFVEIVEMDSSLYDYTGLRCVEGYQAYDIDKIFGPKNFKVLGMKFTVNSDGEFYEDDEDTKEYEGFYAQDWVSLKATLLPNVELPVVIIHAMDSGLDNHDDQTIAPQIGAGGQVDLRLATDNYLGGNAGKITGLTLCLKVTQPA